MSECRQPFKTLNLVGFTVDATQPLALLRDEAGEATFSLWLALEDVMAITVELVAARFSLKGARREFVDSLLEALDLTIDAVSVTGTVADGYCADVRLSGTGRTVAVRVDTATALLLAIKQHLPLEVTEEALASSVVVDQSEGGGDRRDLEQQFLGLLESLSPEDMGKYPI
jgi:bifunctional DNase/RNase